MAAGHRQGANSTCFRAFAGAAPGFHLARHRLPRVVHQDGRRRLSRRDGNHRPHDRDGIAPLVSDARADLSYDLAAYRRAAEGRRSSQPLAGRAGTSATSERRGAAAATPKSKTGQLPQPPRLRFSDNSLRNTHATHPAQHQPRWVSSWFAWTMTAATLKAMAVIAAIENSTIHIVVPTSSRKGSSRPWSSVEETAGQRPPPAEVPQISSLGFAMV